MSSGVLDLRGDDLRMKREYSKGGCRECKRRKIKCDERKPECWQCQRLLKECSYPMAGEKVARVSKRAMQSTNSNSTNSNSTNTNSTNTANTANTSTENNGTKRNNGGNAEKARKNSSPNGRSDASRPPIAANLAPGLVPLPGVQFSPGVGLSPGVHGLSPGSGISGVSLAFPAAPYYAAPPQYSQTHLRTPLGGYMPINRHPFSQFNGYSPNNNHNQPYMPNQVHNQVPNQVSNHFGPYSGLKRDNEGPNLKRRTLSTISPQLPNSPQAALTTSDSAQSSVGNKYTPSSIVSLLNDVNTPNDYRASQSPNSIRTTTTNSSNLHRHSEFPEDGFQDQMLQFFDQDDLNLLASDLNNIVNNIMYNSNFSAKYSPDTQTDTSLHLLVSDNSTSHQGSPHANFESASNHPTPAQRLFQRPQGTFLLKGLPYDYIKVKNSREKHYLQAFYNDFANILLPFGSYDDTTKTYTNPARDIILQCASHESFLLAAVLAHGAKTAYTTHNRAEDEEAYCTYLSKCLKLLGPALSEGNGASTGNVSGNVSGSSGNPANSANVGSVEDKPKGNLTSNIEAVLLTVLLLTSANAANPQQDWRPHLRGAKDILLKVSTLKIKNSKILIFCKFWFVTLEILAGISSTLGGTLRTEAEIDSLITSGDDYEILVLKEIGIIVDGGFSIMAGYHNDAVNHIRDLIKVLAKFRNNKLYKPSDDFEYLDLLSRFYKLSQIEFVDKNCVMSREKYDTSRLRGLVDVLPRKDGLGDVIISWMDTSHQAYILGGIITILTKCFKESHDSPQIQMLSNRIISVAEFLNSTEGTSKQMFKSSIMMIQWPMLVAAMNCVSDKHKSLVEKFFYESGQVGSGSAEFALERVRKIWRMREKGLDPGSDFDDNYNDVLSY